MKTSNLRGVRRRLTAAAVMLSVFMTEQSIIYASGTGNALGETSPEAEQVSEDTPENTADQPAAPKEDTPENTAAQPAVPKEDASENTADQPAGPEEGAAGDTAGQPAAPEEEPALQVPAESEKAPPKRQTEEWHPVCPEEALDAETFLYEQDAVGEVSEDFQYEESYGRQLSDTLAGELYRALKDCWEKAAGEDGEETAEVSQIDLGEVSTADIRLEGGEYEAFRARYGQAVQNAFDAFWYDVTDAEELDREASGLLISYEGENQEDGTCLWRAEAAWELVPEKEDAADEEPDAENEESAGDAEGNAALGETASYAYLEAGFREISELWAADDSEEPKEETYARMFRRLCEQAGIECVLVKGAVDKQAGVWNAVRMEDENWYIADVVRGLFLKGTGAQTGEDTEAVRLAYGDFSDSHQGCFIYPNISLDDYPEPEVTEEITEPEQEQIQALPEELSAEPELSEPEQQTEENLPPEESVQAELYSLATAAEEDARAVQAPQEKALTPRVTVSAVKTQTYSGRALTPKVTVKDASTRKTLKVGKQYTVSYENNVNAGTGVIVIRGIASAGYDGVLRVNFTINPQKITKARSKITGKGFVYTGQPVTPGVSVTYNKTGLRAGVDYQISYINNTAKGRAQIQITGMGNFTGTKVLKFSIGAKKMKETTVTLSSYSAVFTGTNAMPSVTVKYGDMVCRPNVDYTVSYPKKLKVGKNNITIKGRGNFSGSVKVTYTVSKASLASARVQLPYAWKYTGKSIKVLPSSVVISGVALKTNKDFKVQYQDAGGKRTGTPKKPGNYRIVLTGKGNYQGTLTYNFCITGAQDVLDQNYNSPDGPPKPKPDPPAPVQPDTSPGDKVPVEKDTYFGYYEGYKIFSKKGIQGVSGYTEDLRVQHVLLNVDMADLISPTARSGYLPYTYRGKTYYFSDLVALKNTVYFLHGWGSKDGSPNPYGMNHNRNVTFVLLMSWKDELSYLIHPSARRRGAAPYYALNMQEAAARDTFEALFRYMGEEFGEYKTRVSNWTLGNEVNSCKGWNYSGSLPLKDCAANYAQAFQLLDKGVKRAATSSRLFLSLDHCWTASVAGHGGKEFLDQFAAYMNQTAPGVQWNVNYHPYSSPLTQAAFWTNTSSTSANVNTKYISMQNIQVLTDYLSGIERQYGKAGGSIRVIIGELGYTAVRGNEGQERLQAAALGYGYYIAMFNRRIDSYIIRAYVDDPAETSDKLYLGLRDQSHQEKPAYEVYKNLDTAQSLSVMSQYLSTVGISGWQEKIPGFSEQELTAKEF